MEMTPTILQRAARQMVARHSQIEAVVLFGSRARGTAALDSDWDVAILVDGEPDDSVRAAIPSLANVNVLFESPDNLAERANVAGSVESAIVRDGDVLAGTWNQPIRSGEPIVDNDVLAGHLEMAADSAGDAMRLACQVMGGRHRALKKVSREIQGVSEFTAKAALVHLGVDPERVHDLPGLANQLKQECPHDYRAVEWSEIIRGMNGLSRERHSGVYRAKPIEPLEQPLAILRDGVRFFVIVFRDIVETRADFAPHAVEVAAAVSGNVADMQVLSRWALIPQETRDRFHWWDAEVKEIRRLAELREQTIGSPTPVIPEP